MDLDFRPEWVCGRIVQHLSQTPNLSRKSEEHGVSVSEPSSSFHLDDYGPNMLAGGSVNGTASTTLKKKSTLVKKEDLQLEVKASRIENAASVLGS